MRKSMFMFLFLLECSVDPIPEDSLVRITGHHFKDKTKELSTGFLLEGHVYVTQHGLEDPDKVTLQLTDDTLVETIGNWERSKKWDLMRIRVKDPENFDFLVKGQVQLRINLQKTY